MATASTNPREVFLVLWIETNGQEITTEAFACACGYILPAPSELGRGYYVAECPQCEYLYAFHIYARKPRSREIDENNFQVKDPVILAGTAGETALALHRERSA